MLNRERSSAASAPRFLREVGSFAIRTGLVIGAAGLLLLWLSNHVWNDDETTQRTLLLSLLVLLGLTTLLRALTDGETRRSVGDRRFHFLAAASLLVYLAILYWPLTGDFFALTPLTPWQWGRLLALACGAYLVLRLSDVLCRSWPGKL